VLLHENKIAHAFARNGSEYQERIFGKAPPITATYDEQHARKHGRVHRQPPRTKESAVILVSPDDELRCVSCPHLLEDHLLGGGCSLCPCRS